MYDDLVKRLREHNGWALNETLDKAADAIEELQQIAKHYEEESKGWWLAACDFKEERERLLEARPRWIPVEERLPEKYHQVLCYGVNGVSIDYYSGETSDTLFVLGKPLFIVSEARVTHWMPLPEPPKEET